MHFQQYGRTCQLNVATISDLRDVCELNEAHWVASSAPVSAFRVDPKFLSLLDPDANGRIISSEVKAAVHWFLDHISLPGDTSGSSDTVHLKAIRTDVPTGAALVQSAHYVLGVLDSPDGETISLTQIRQFLSSFRSMPLNGDGIIVQEAAEDEETIQFLKAICTATGGTLDASGRMGITEAQLNAFVSAIPLHLEWREQGKLPGSDQTSAILPFGERTSQLCELFDQHASAVDHYFELCRLVKFRPDSLPKWEASQSPSGVSAPLGCEDVRNYMAQFPIAMPHPSGNLNLDIESINPLFQSWIKALCESILSEVLSPDVRTLSSNDWEKVSAVFSPFKAYRQNTPGPMLLAFASGDLKRFSEEKLAANVKALIEMDRKVSVTLAQAREVERLLLYRLHLMQFLNNFISFPQLYSQAERALFEMGSAVIDGRWLNFAVEVDDPSRHAAVAKMSNLYVLYMEITGTATEKFLVASPVTSGSKGNLGVGKRGVFFDVSGKQYDARVIQVVDNPVSIREALAMPFVRLWSLAEGKLETWSTSAEKDLTKTVTAPTSASTAIPAQTIDKAGTGGFGSSAFMGFGVTLAALGSAFAFVTKTFAGLNATQLVFGFFATALAVMLPVSLIATIKLRRQDVSALLESSGWAINARMRLSRGQRRFFTQTKPFPADATGVPQHRRRNILIGTMLTLLVVWLAISFWLQSS